MKSVKIGEKCVALPDYGIETESERKGLSHRVCYTGHGLPMKKGDGKCEECSGYKDIDFVSKQTQPSGIDCKTLVNLGDEFSAASNIDRCYPPITVIDANPRPFSESDDHVAVFVGGNFIERNAAEVEGKVVTLGDLTVERNGPSNFVSVGAGSHIIPTPNTDCILVGGALNTARDVQVYNLADWMKCNIVYKGSATNKDGWKTNGSVIQNPNLDLSFYENMKYVFEKKSKYWKTLASTGTLSSDGYGETRITCSTRKEPQVFNFFEKDRRLLDKPHTFQFGDDCEGKTILINVHGSGRVNVNAAAMRWKNRQGYRAGGFPTCMTESILWNFPDADEVDIGNGKTSEFHGSILAVGDLILSTSGHSGRTIVLGDLLHDSKSGSEFHSYDFNPPIPLPDPDDICVFPEDLSYGSVAAYPTQAPTKSPTPAPTPALTDCRAIPKKELPKGVSSTEDKHCRQCFPGSSVTWWPCNLNPPICYGNCQLFNQ
jgi:choice-of-anchor A domain-containing protein